MTAALSLPTVTLSTSSTNSARDTETKSGDNSNERKQLELSQTQIQRHVESHLAVTVTTQHSSPPNYQYSSLDGELYVVSDDVVFDTSSEPNDPQATLEKAQLIRMASMAPTDPTPQDRKASQQAIMMAAQEKSEINTASIETLGNHVDVLV